MTGKLWHIKEEDNGRLTIGTTKERILTKDSDLAKRMKEWRESRKVPVSYGEAMAQFVTQGIYNTTKKGGVWSDLEKMTSYASDEFYEAIEMLLKHPVPDAPKRKVTLRAPSGFAVTSARMDHLRDLNTIRFRLESTLKLVDQLISDRDDSKVTPSKMQLDLFAEKSV